MLVGTTYYVTSVHFCLHSTCDIHCNPHLLAYHIFQQFRDTKLWKKVPKLNLKFNKLNKKLNTKQAEDNLDNPIDDLTESVNLDQLCEP